jgi:hypothetical protein
LRPAAWVWMGGLMGPEVQYPALPYYFYFYGTCAGWLLHAACAAAHAAAQQFAVGN